MRHEVFVPLTQGSKLTLIPLQLGMQEALAHYAGSDPTQGAQYFLDTFFSMGVRMFELVPGKPLFLKYCPIILLTCGRL